MSSEGSMSEEQGSSTGHTTTQDQLAALGVAVLDQATLERNVEQRVSEVLQQHEDQQRLNILQKELKEVAKVIEDKEKNAHLLEQHLESMGRGRVRAPAAIAAVAVAQRAAEDKWREVEALGLKLASIRNQLETVGQGQVETTEGSDEATVAAEQAEKLIKEGLLTPFAAYCLTQSSNVGVYSYNNTTSTFTTSTTSTSSTTTTLTSPTIGITSTAATSLVFKGLTEELPASSALKPCKDKQAKQGRKRKYGEESRLGNATFSPLCSPLCSRLGNATLSPFKQRVKKLKDCSGVDDADNNDSDGSDYMPSDASEGHSSEDDSDLGSDVSPTHKVNNDVVKATQLKLKQNLKAIKKEALQKRKEKEKKYKSKSSTQRIKDDSKFKRYQKRLKKWKKERLQAKLDKIERRLTKNEDESESSNDEDDSFEQLGDGMKIPAALWKKLYKYQQTGVRWMWELHSQGCGGILGDEMGLGKTIQLIAFLCGLRCGGGRNSSGGGGGGLGAVLIVCPATLLLQWLKELHDWWPPFRVALLHESGGHKGNRAVLIHNIHQDCGILMTSYNGVCNNIDALLRYTWHYVVLDEGHKIRNPEAQITMAVKRFNTPHRLILSGSPIQNGLKELWSLFDFVFPGKLGTLIVFLQQFSVPITRSGFATASRVEVETGFRCAVVLRDTINPYLLRRMKVDVKDHLTLTNKSEQVLFCGLTEEQRSTYRGYLESDQVSNIMNGRMKVFVGLINLRKICNHSDLYTGGPDASHGFGTANENSYGWWERSGKMQVVDGVLRLWKQQGHRVLLFTQSAQMLKILERYLVHVNYTYLKMSGVTNMSDRQNLVHKFNTDENIFVFALTTRVGGVGLNLTGANRVLIYDPDWNPSTDTQARERAYRIGQTKDVTIYRLLTAGTIEEKIYHRQIFKQFLTNRILKDPKQQRFFKTNDLFDLFTLADKKDDNSTESSVLFAGLGSEVTCRKMKLNKNIQRGSIGRGSEISKKTQIKCNGEKSVGLKPSNVSQISNNNREKKKHKMAKKECIQTENSKSKSKKKKVSPVKLGNLIQCRKNEREGQKVKLVELHSQNEYIKVDKFSSDVLVIPNDCRHLNNTNDTNTTNTNTNGAKKELVIPDNPAGIVDRSEKQNVSILPELSNCTEEFNDKILLSNSCIQTNFNSLKKEKGEVVNEESRNTNSVTDGCNDVVDVEKYSSGIGYSTNEKYGAQSNGCRSEITASFPSETVTAVQGDSCQDASNAEAKKKEKMKKLARLLSQKIARKSTTPETVTKYQSSHKEIETENNLVKELITERRSKHSKNSTNNKKKGKKLEGEHIKYLVKKRKFKNRNEEDEASSKAQDEYVLYSLFQKSGVKTVLKHDVIINSNDTDYLLLESEAKRVAEDALKYVEASRSQCLIPKLPSNNCVPGNLMKKRFGSDETSCSFSSKALFSGEPSGSTAAGGGSSSGGSGNSGGSSSGSGGCSSTSLLARIRERNNAALPVDDEEDSNDGSEGETNQLRKLMLPVLDSMNAANVSLLEDIRNFVAFQSAVNGRATTVEILNRFQDKLPKEKTHVFKAILKQICDFRKDSEGVGWWHIKVGLQ